MKLNISQLIIICVLSISCNFGTSSHDQSKRSDRTIDEKFLGAWVSVGVKSINNRKPKITDTSDAFNREEFLIIKKENGIEGSYRVNYREEIGGPDLFTMFDDNTLTHSLKPVMDGELTIKYIEDSGHLTYNFTDDPSKEEEFIKLK